MWIDSCFSVSSALGYRRNDKAKRKFQDGETFFYLGQPFELQVIPTPAKRGSFKVQGDQWLVFIPKDLKRSEKKSTTKWLLEDWYRTQAEKLIPERIDIYQKVLKVEPLKIRIRTFESQWGSCTSRKTLSFHWSLLIAPIEILDYVVVHELAHLVHMNHSRRFWNTVAKALPDYAQRRKWLRLHEANLRLDRIPSFSATI